MEDMKLELVLVQLCGVACAVPVLFLCSLV